MKTLSITAVPAAIALCLCTAGLRAEGPPDPSWKLPADNHIYAQQVVNETMAKNPDLLVIGIHANLPGTKDERMVATNLPRVGKVDDDDDKGAAQENKTVLAPNQTKPEEFEVLMPLHDSSGNTIGAVGLVYKYKKGEDQRKLLDKATKIRDDFAKKFKTADDMFKPAN